MFLHIVTVTVAMLLSHFANQLPCLDPKQIESLSLRQSILVYDSNNELLTHIGDLQLKVSFDAVPKRIINALLATEDMLFWSHFGLNVGAMSVAVLENMSKKSIVRGGSTVTQQLAKNLLLTNDQALIRNKTKRKILEIWFALQIERILTKEQILEAYLNRIYFGRGAYGIQAAAKLYFDKTMDQLTLEEIVYLVGLVRAPSMYAGNFDKAISRALHVLNRMYKAGFIQKKYTKTELYNLIKPVKHNLQFCLGHFVNWAITTIPKDISDSKEPIILYTTVDTNLQKRVFEEIPKIKEKSRFNFTELAFIGCGLDGSVKVMIGGANNNTTGGFNRATQAFRQAGSTFKIYTCMCALLQGMRGTDTIEDTPPTIGGWTPSNYMHNEVGFVTLERAFTESINGAIVRIAMECGLNNIINLARVFGLTGTLPNDCSLILGSASVTLQQLAQTMLILSNKGYQTVPYGIKEIRSHSGTILRSHLEEQAPMVIIGDKEAIQQMMHIMEETVNRGTGRFAKNSQYPVGGKTGTSQNYRDVWFVATSPFLVTCAWCGNDDYSPMDKSTKAGLINPSVALCKSAIQFESEGYEEETESPEQKKSDLQEVDMFDD